MDEYISRQAALNKINERQRKLIYCFGFENDAVKIMDIAKSIVTAMPSAQREIEPADVVQVRHGKWTHKPDVYGVVYCSECDYELHTNSTSYCPNCGAKMDREE